MKQGEDAKGPAGVAAMRDDSASSGTSSKVSEAVADGQHGETSNRGLLGRADSRHHASGSEEPTATDPSHGMRVSTDEPVCNGR